VTVKNLVALMKPLVTVPALISRATQNIVGLAIFDALLTKVASKGFVGVRLTNLTVEALV